MSAWTDRQDRTQILLKRRWCNVNPDPPCTGDLLPLHNVPVQGGLRFTTQVSTVTSKSCCLGFERILPNCKAETWSLLSVWTEQLCSRAGCQCYEDSCFMVCHTASQLQNYLTGSVGPSKSHFYLLRKKIPWQNTVVVHHKANTVFANFKPSHVTLWKSPETEQDRALPCSLMFIFWVVTQRKGCSTHSAAVESYPRLWAFTGKRDMFRDLHPLSSHSHLC